MDVAAAIQLETKKENFWAEPDIEAKSVLVWDDEKKEDKNSNSSSSHVRLLNYNGTSIILHVDQEGVHSGTNDPGWPRSGSRTIKDFKRRTFEHPRPRGWKDKNPPWNNNPGSRL